MSVVLRLKRMGANKKACFRVIVAEKTSPRDGRFIEELGYYDPRKNPASIKINGERASYWLKNGAQPSVTVKSLLKKQGIKK